MTSRRPAKLRRPTRTRKADARFAVCIDNAAYPASLERWKIYRLVPDPDAERHAQVRVVDESGDDYLFPAACFRLVDLPPGLRRLYRATAVA